MALAGPRRGEALTSLSQARVSEQLEFFLKGFQGADGAPKYRSRIAQMIAEGKASVLVDYEDLLSFDTDLAIALVQKPDSILPSFKEAAYEAVKTENLTYADDRRDELDVRIKGITDKLPLRAVAAKYLDRLVAINGMVVRTSEVQPLALVAAFRCPNGHLTLVPQKGSLLKQPTKCGECEESRNLELDKSNSKFTDYQVIRIQELPEELPPGQLPTSLDAEIVGEMVSKARPGDRVIVTGTVRAEPESAIGRGKLTVFRTTLETNYVDVSGKEPDQIAISPEDEAEIRRLASLPDAYDRLINSIAPSIYGFETQKEAVLLMVTGAPQGILPDGTTIRGDVNCLMVGDPGCLVADERIVLGDGRIAKIGSMGSHHLEQIQKQVLTGTSGGHRAWATTFHVYRNQPVIELVTESGKSIKGTYNHPLMAVWTEERRQRREWRRLDQFKVGDKVEVVTSFHCNVRSYVDTGFAPIVRSRFGPRFHRRLPQKVTPELASFLGHMVGDGWVCKDGYRFGFVVAEPELDILPRLQALAKGLFGFENPKASETVKKGRKVHLHYVYLSDKDITSNLMFLREKRVPDMIFASGDFVVSRFLRFLYEADGTVFDKGRGRRAVGLKAKNIELLRDVQVLLLRFGIHSRIVDKALLIRRGRDIIRFRERVGFVSDKKRNRLSELAEHAKSFRRFRSQHTERIVKILKHPNQDVYDIEVPEGHRFIANGVISHNTAKSELLKYVARIAPRGLYTTGRGSTAAGLCVAPDTLVITPTGPRTIEEVVEEQLSRGEQPTVTGETVASSPTVLSVAAPVLKAHDVLVPHRHGALLTSELAIPSVGVGSASQYFRIEATRTLGIKTVGGRRIKLTPETKLACYDVNLGMIQWKKAGDIDKGGLVVLASKFAGDAAPTCSQRFKTATSPTGAAPQGTVKYPGLGVDFVLDSVSEVVQEGACTVYDLTIDGSHSFVGNGFIVHNTAAVVKEKSGLMMLEAGAVVLADQGVACLADDTELYTGLGLVPVGRIWESSQAEIEPTKTGREAKEVLIPVGIYDNANRCDIASHAFAVLRKKFKGDMIKLHFSSGLALTVTPEHLLRKTTSSKSLWIPAGNVKPGEVLRSPVRVFSPSVSVSVSPEEAYVAGCVYGDGWVTPYSITISQSKVNLDILQSVERHATGVFARYDKGDRPRTLGKYHLISSMYQLFTSDKATVERAHFLLRSPSTDNIFLLSDEALWAFLAGVFDTDGDFNHANGKIIAARLYPATSQHELAVILYALRRLGVMGRIRKTRRGFPIVQVTGPDISRLAEGIKAFSVKVSREGPIHIEHKENIVRGQEEVLSVEHVPYDGYVYDLSVGKYHNFEASLVYAHNCIDEFDKMRAEDRGVLHEVMEQQSYHPSTEVLLASGAKVRIGDYVDSVFKRHSGEVFDGKDCQIVRLSDGDEVLSFDYRANKMVREKIDRVSRHLPPSYFVGITYSNGRKVLVTPEHPVYVFKGGRVETLRADEVQTNDFVPAPRILPALSLSLPHLRGIVRTGRKLLSLPTEMTPGLARILGYLITEGHFYRGSSYEIGFSNKSPVLLSQMSRLMRESIRIGFSTHTTKEDVVTQRYISKDLFKWFQVNFPEMMHKARHKRVPAPIMSAPAGIVREFLAAAFLGDGSVETESMCYRTASRGLSEDYQDLLLRLGIASRILVDTSNNSFKVYITGDSLPFFASVLVEGYHPMRTRVDELAQRSTATNRRHDVLPPEVARRLISIRHRLGLPYDGRFDRHLKRGHGITRETVADELAVARDRERQIDGFLIGSSQSLRELRSVAGLSQASAAMRVGVPRGVINYAEAGGYPPQQSITLFSHLKSAVESDLCETVGMLTSIEALMGLRFLRVSKIETIANEGSNKADWVYDITIEPFHNFISSGVILHNTVSVAKGGIVATLNARTSILAAANPVFGKYDPYKNIYENVSLPTPLLTRFDLVFIIRDIPDRAKDEKLASHILETHRSEAFTVQPPLDFEMLRKYLIYAKKMEPKLTREAQDRLLQFYLDLRNSSTEGTIAITPRQLEGLIRIATARARLLLRDKVTIEDALQAIALMRKMLESVGIDVRTGKVDLGVLQGRPASERGILEKAMDVFRQLYGPDKKPVEAKAFADELVKTGDFSAEEAKRVISTLYKLGQIYEIRTGYYSKIS